MRKSSAPSASASDRAPSSTRAVTIMSLTPSWRACARTARTNSARHAGHVPVHLCEVHRHVRIERDKRLGSVLGLLDVSAGDAQT